jgi:probable F420-dependent oxidoreductase
LTKVGVLRLGISLQPRWPIDSAAADVVYAARRVEELGFDHVAVGNRLLDSGFGLDADPLVLLAALAGATTRLRLLTSVLVAPYYPALLLANQAATLDVVSSGRLILGVGTGWNPAEFSAVGASVGSRGALTDDRLAAAKALWSRRPADYDGRFTSVHDAYLGVPPLTPGGPPVWVGGHSDAALRRALRFGDGWYGTGVSAGEVAEVGLRLRALEVGGGGGGDGEGAALASRLTLGAAAFLTPPGIPAVFSAPGRLLGGEAPDAAGVAEELLRLGEAGLSVCTLWMPIAAAHVERAAEWVAEYVAPRLRG